MLRKARKVIPRESCLTLYNAMIIPVFDYYAVVWDSCSKADREYLDKLHRRHGAASSQYYKRLHSRTIANISHFRLAFAPVAPGLSKEHTSLHGLAPAYLLDEISHARDFLSCNTRHSDLLSLPLARTTNYKYQGFFRFSGEPRSRTRFLWPWGASMI